MGKSKDDNVVYVEGCPDWMMTMGDCMSLLLTFFVLLMTFSTPDASKLLDMVGGIQGALSMVDSGGFDNVKKSMYTGGKKADGKMEDGQDDLIRVASTNVSPINLRTMKVVNKFNEFKQRIAEAGFKNDISAKQMAEGILIEIKTDDLFIPATLQISPKKMPILEDFCNLASSPGMDNELRLTIVFSTGSSPVSSAREWYYGLTSYRNRLFALARIMENKYGINHDRFTYACKEMAVAEPKIQILLLDKLSTSEISVNDLINLRQKKK